MARETGGLPEAQSSPGNSPGGRPELARELLHALDTAELARYSVVGTYVRFDDRTRHSLKEFRQRVVAALDAQSLHPKNFLLWGEPGSGKSYLVQQIASTLERDVEFRELNLARSDERSLSSALKALEVARKPILFFIDEIDARSDQTWPYETLLPHLDPPVPRPFPTCFCLAGSGGRSLTECEELIRGRPKGADLMSRIPNGHDFAVSALTVGDKVLISLMQLLEASREEGRMVREVEKLALYFIAVNPELSSARQLRGLASQCAQRIPVGEDRIRYDFLFPAGDPANKKFWAESEAYHGELTNVFVTVEGAPLVPSGSTSMPSRKHPRQKIAAIEGAADRLAVLPLVNMSPDPRDEYFADGLTEELISVLSQVRGLRVISRTSAMSYKSTHKSVSQIGSELGVVSILEGSVRMAGRRLRVTAQLIDADSDRHLWGKTFDRELDDVLAVQAEIAKQVAEALEVELRPADAAHLDPRTPVRSDSYLAYLKGRTLMRQQEATSYKAAKEQFDLAISLDPRNAAAYSGLSDLVRLVGPNYLGMSRTEAQETGRRLAERALELDPDLAEVHATTAFTLWSSSYDWPGAEREFKRALMINPSYSQAHHWYAELLSWQYRTDEALEEWALAEGSDPLAPFNLSHYAVFLTWIGRYEEALARIEKLGELQPNRLEYIQDLALLHRARSEGELYLKDLERLEALESDPTRLRELRAEYYAFTGEKEKCRALLREELKSSPPGFAPFSLVWFYAALGDLDDCFHWLERAFELRSILFHMLRYDSLFEQVRRDPRFQVLLRKANLT